VHLQSEINVTGRVNDVDAVLLPEAGRRGRRDGDAALALLHRRTNVTPCPGGMQQVCLPAECLVDLFPSPHPSGRRQAASSRALEPAATPPHQMQQAHPSLAIFCCVGIHGPQPLRLDRAVFKGSPCSCPYPHPRQAFTSSSAAF